MAPDNADAVWINQDAWFSLGNFTKDFSINYQLKKSGNGVYVFVLEGDLEINGQAISTRDGLGISEVAEIEIKAITDAQIVFIEIPMNVA